jgi:transposase-like protein
MSSAFPPGRGSQVTPDERREIQCLRLVDGDSVSEIARKTGRNRETIANVLQAEDTHALRVQLENEGKEAAMRELQSARHRAARAWGTAMQQAADRGDHRPAKDLLLHTGVIQPLEKGGMNFAVQVVVGTSEHPAGPDPFEGITITQRSDNE